MASVDNYGLGKLGKIQRATLEACCLPSKNVKKRPKLCRDLLDAEPDIATCEIYGERGQRQDGIDLRAYRKESNGIVVGQYKCYQDFPHSIAFRGNVLNSSRFS